jgi:8-oxo-dGTP pyrophosphatase MutT (NUDIX family)
VTEAIARQAGRVLLVDASGRLLLLHGWDPGRPEHRYWFTPGGGLDAGESSAAAAARELGEEAGLRVAPERLGEPVWREVTEFPFDGRRYRQSQDYFLLRVDSVEVDQSGMNEMERGSIDGYRWWSLAELDRTAERYYPAELPTLLRALTGPHRTEV